MARVRFFSLLGCALLLLYVISGCSGGGSALVTPSSDEGTARVLIANPWSTRAALDAPLGLPVARVGLILSQDALGTMPPLPLDPASLIPIMDTPQLLALLPALQTNYLEMIEAQVPAGLYSGVTITLDTANLQALAGLPSHLMTNTPVIIPFAEGLPIEAGEMHTVMVDLMTKTVTVEQPD